MAAATAAAVVVVLVAPVTSSAQTDTADGCVRDLGTLDATTTSASGSGIIAVDSSCTSPQRDPESQSTFYARRHTFTLDDAATISVSLNGPYPHVLLIQGSSSDGTGTVVARTGSPSSRTSVSRQHLLLAAGTYTIEATTHYGGTTGGYTVSVQRWAADGCVRDLGTLDATTTSASGTGIIAVDSSCTSSQRDPNDAVSVYYARRHTFTLDDAATISVSVDDRSPASVRTYLVLSDASDVVLGRAAGDSRYKNSRLDRLLLAAGTYTIEATTTSPGDTGGYTAWVQRWAADGCVRDLGTLDATTTSASGTGIIAVDSSCTSSQRDPNDAVSVYYARRHTFTLDDAATISVSVDDRSPASVRTYLVLSDASDVVLGRAAGDSRYKNSRLDRLLLAAGTYTIEATTTSPGDTGGYTAWVQRWAADGCVRDLGTLDATTTSASGTGIIAVDSSCTSSQRDPNDAVSVYYARRHTFTLDDAATISVSVDDRSPASVRTYLVLSDASDVVLGRAAGDSRYKNSRLDRLLLAAGTYTIEATTTSPGDTGGYTAWVQRWAADGCVRDLGTLDATTTSASGTGIIAVDSSCTSSQRDPNDAVSVYYARRHTFTLDDAATISVSVDDRSPASVRTYLVLSDASDVVLGRAAGDSRYKNSRLDRLLLAAGTYTIEATTTSPGDTGGYTAWVQRWAADGCVRDLGTLDATTTSASGTGIIAVDSSCTSSQRDPNDAVSVYYARRHTFTLDDAATISVSVDDRSPASVRTYLVLSDASDVVLGRAAGDSRYKNSRLDRLLLAAGTYTIEATTTSPGDTGGYTAWVQRWAADGCVRDLGTLDATTTSASGTGIIAVDSSCTSSQRDPNDAVSVYYARRHTFTLDDAATISVSVDDRSPASVRTYLVLSDASDVVLGRAAGDSRYKNSRLDRLLLAAGTYTIEATTTSPGDTGGYTAWVQRWAADGCVRDLGTLDATTTSASGTGIIAVDSSCTSSQRDPNDAVSVYYARRHTFTLDDAATISVSVDDRSPASVRTYLVLSDASDVVLGRAAGDSRYKNSRLDRLLLAAGTYTIEATTHYGGTTGGYTVSVQRWAADGCVRDLGTLDAVTTGASGSGIIAVDADCTSSLRDPADTVSVYYARRHTFTLDAAATVSVSMGPAEGRSHLVLSDSSGTVLGRDQGVSRVCRPTYLSAICTDARSPGLDYLLLPAGIYTVEATTGSAGQVGPYTVRVDWAAGDACVRDLGTLDAVTTGASGSGIIAVDADCTSSLRDPADTVSVYYARRHTFTLDAAATVSVSMGPAEGRSHLVLSDSSGTVLGRDQGVSRVCRPTYLSAICTDARSPGLDYLLLPAGIYTVEATTGSAGQVGPYTVRVDWAAGDACVRDLGTLDAVTTSASGSGIIAVDADCTSSLRDPADTVSVYYARRHTFTLDAAATVSVSMGPAEGRSHLVLSDSSGTVLGRDQGVSRVCRPTYLSAICTDARSPGLDYLLLPAGIYTVEATTGSAGQVGPYTVRVDWAAGDACVRDLGTLDAVTTSASGSGIIAVDADCTSSLRDPADTVSVYYARRHTFTLDAAATVSVSMGPAEGRSHLVLSDSSGTVLGRDQGVSRVCRPTYLSAICTDARSPGLDYLLLPAGIYTVEATTGSAGQVGPYTVRVDWAAGDACVRDLGTLDAVTTSASGSGIIAVDADCTSSLRDPGGTSTYYARRHTFTLDAAATVSVSMGPFSSSSYLVLSDSSGAVVGSNGGRDRSCYRGSCASSEPARLDHLLLAAGTYTVEATKSSPLATGAYTVAVNWWTMPPTGLSCVAMESSLEISWDALAGADRYQVSSDGGSTWVEPAPVASTSHTFLGLTADGSYALSVQAGNDEGAATIWSAASNRLCNTAFSIRPTGLACTSTATSIALSWDAVGGADTYTAIVESATPNGTRRKAERITTASVEFIGLDPSTDYFLSVFAVSGGRQRLPAGKDCATLVAVANPGRPVCSATTDSSIALRWGSEAGVHQWYVARATADSHTDGSALGSATLTKRFTGLAPNTTYQFYFWWRASASGSWVQVKPDVQCTTTGPGTSPAPPICGVATVGTITLRWGSDAGVHQWHISRATVPDTARATASPTQTDGRTLGSSTLETTFDGLSHATFHQFYFWWKASATDDWTAVEPHATCTTAALSSYPTPPACGTASQSSVELRWGSHSSVYKWHIARPGAAGALIDSRLLEGSTLSANFTGLNPSTANTFPLWWQASSVSDWQQARPDRSCTTQEAPATPVSTACATTAKYCATRGVYDAVLRAAQKAITASTGAVCTQAQLTDSGRSQITQNMLASMMLAIPESELLTNDLTSSYTNRALSPMTLSRGDNMVNRRSDSNNIQLYSHMTLGGYKRAHWNPGVGLWQLDIFTEPRAQVDALKYGHAERADVDKGGYEVAKYIRYQYCGGGRVFRRWVACNNGSCQTRHNNRYNTTTDSFQAEIVEGLTDPTGGVQERLCRWGAAGMTMVCYLYDLSLKEGYVKIACCQSGGGGANPYTPEAAPFISFTDTTTSSDFSTKYAVWPKSWPSSSSGLAWPTTTAAGSGEAAKTVIRAVKASGGARFSPYNDDSDLDHKGIAHHGLMKLASETVAQYEARIEAKIATLHGGPLTVKNSADNYGLNTDGQGPEGWFDSTVNGHDLQIYNCAGTIGDMLIEACWVSTNAVASSGSNQ